MAMAALMLMPLNVFGPHLAAAAPEHPGVPPGRPGLATRRGQPHCDICGGTGSGPAVVETITTAYGFDARPLNWFQHLDATSHVALGAASGGLAENSDLSGGLVTLGSSAFGFASASARQPLGVSYVPVSPSGERLPTGTSATLHVSAYVVSRLLTAGLSGVGVSCGETAVAFETPTNTSQDTLSNCLGTLGVAVPLPGAEDTTEVSAEEDAGQALAVDAASEAESSGSSMYSDLHDVKEGVEAAGRVDRSVRGLLAAYQGDVGRSRLSVFSWDGTVKAGPPVVFAIEPQVSAMDSGGGVEFNLVNCAIDVVVTEQYVVGSGTEMFPPAEVGHALLEPDLAEDMTVTLTQGALPPGLHLTTKTSGGSTIVALAGAPTRAGPYHFTLQYPTMLLQCTLDVAPALTVSRGPPGNWVLVSGGDQDVAALPLVATGGVGTYSWRLEGAPKSIALAPPEGSTPPRLEGLASLRPGRYSFQVHVSDLYTATGHSLGLVVVNALALHTSAPKRLGGGRFAVLVQATVHNALGPVRGDPLRLTAYPCGALVPQSAPTSTSGVLTARYVSCAGAHDVVLRAREGDSGAVAAVTLLGPGGKAGTNGPSTTVPLPGRVLGLAAEASGQPVVVVAPLTANRALVTPANRLWALTSGGTPQGAYSAPYATGALAVDGHLVDWAALSGASYLVWRVHVGTLDLATGQSTLGTWNGVAAGVGGIAAAAASPVWLGTSTIGGPHGLPDLTAYDPGTRHFSPVAVPSSTGGGVGAVALGTTGRVAGVVPESRELFVYDPARHHFEVTAPLTGVPTGSLTQLTWAPSGQIWALAAWSGHAALVHWAPPGTPQVLDLPPAYVTASGLVWDEGAWVIATTRSGQAGVLSVPGSATGTQWGFRPFSAATPQERFAAATRGPGPLWVARVGGTHLWSVPLRGGTRSPPG